VPFCIYGVGDFVEFLVVLGSVQKSKGRISGSLPQIKAGIFLLEEMAVLILAMQIFSQRMFLRLKLSGLSIDF